ncbi:hypothetical protein [Spirosoma flavum]|uniref:MFS transporter n=1 Tax=Spirosoma flavum TaxID=2048557 RepID=A0ABW6AF82_9BACT
MTSVARSREALPDFWQYETYERTQKFLFFLLLYLSGVPLNVG